MNYDYIYFHIYNWFSKKGLHQIELPYDPAIPLLGIHTEETRRERDTCTPMFITALFIIARTWKQPRCPSADELVENVNEAVKDTPGVTDVALKLVFEPEWDKSRMSEEAMLELGLL